MLQHRFPKSNFKGFMAINTQANWNIIKIVYGYGDPSIKMVNKKCTYLFHSTQLLDRHTKKPIKSELQNQHNVLCHQYKNAKSLGEANNLYAIICCWWLSLRVASKVNVHELGNELSFWHFCVKQWGGFMVHVSISPTNFLWFPLSFVYSKLKFHLHSSSIYTPLPFELPFLLWHFRFY